MTVYELTALTGGGTNALDAIPVADLADGDLAIVTYLGGFYVFRFVAAATDAETTAKHPIRIRPDDYLSAGVWYEYATDGPFSWIDVGKKGAIGDGSSDDTSAIEDAIGACLQSGSATYDGGVLYFPKGIFKVTTLQGVWGSGKIIVVGSGQYNTCLYSPSGATVIDMSDLTSGVGIHIRDMAIKGSNVTGTGHGIHINVTGAGNYANNVTISNVRVREFVGKGIYIQDGFNVSLDMVDVDLCGDNAIHVRGRNSTNLRNCYVHQIASDKYAYRVEGGYTLLQSCLGIDGCWDQPSTGKTRWAHFGNYASEGLYARATLIGCTVEDWNDVGLYFEEGSAANFFSTNILGAEDSPNLIALLYDKVYAKHLPLFDSLSRISHKGGTSTWKNGSPIQSYNAPLMLLGYNFNGTPEDLIQYYDSDLLSLQDLPNIQGVQTALGHFGLKINHFEMGDLWGVTYRSGAGSPLSSVTPRFTGELYLDTSTNRWWISKGTANTDWQPASYVERTGSGTPVGAATPGFTGQEYQDTATKRFWKATGAANTDWQPLTYLYKSGSSDPNGSVTVGFIGQEYLNTSAGTWWKAKGLNNTDWVQIG
jgi:hypothetical protein